MISYQKILDLCDKKGVKVTNVEKELGLSKGSLKKVEKSTPNAEKIYALAKYFGVPTEAFFEEEQPALSKYSDAIGTAVEYCRKYEEDEDFRARADEIEAGLPMVTVHGLRHTFASMLNSEQIDIARISAELGHSNISTTLNIYMHVFGNTTESSRGIASAINAKLDSSATNMPQEDNEKPPSIENSAVLW